MKMIKRLLSRLINLFFKDFDTKYCLKVFRYLNLYKSGKKSLARIVYNSVRKKTSCDISYKANISDGFYIAHMDGILIGETAVIEKGVVCFPHVHIVSNVIHNLDENNELNTKRHAIIGENTLLGDRCTIIGPIRIGKNCIIASCAIVTKDVPDNSVVKGINGVSKNPMDNKEFFNKYPFCEKKMLNMKVWDKE